MSASDHVPLGDRLAVLQGARLIAVATIVAVIGIRAEVVEVSVAAVVVPIVVYAALTTGLEVLRSRRRSRSIAVVTWLSLLDVAVLVGVVTVTGGPQSPFLVLCYLQVVAATLVVSYRTGLKAAVLYALALPAAEATAGYGILADVHRAGDQVSAVSSLTFLVFAIVTAVFSSFNERALRSSRLLSQTLADMAIALEAAEDVGAVGRIVALHVQRALPGATVAVAIDVEGGTVAAVADGEEAREVSAVGNVLENGRRWQATDEPARLIHLPNHEADPFIASLLPDATNVVLLPLLADHRQFGLILADVRGGTKTRVPVATIDTLTRMANHAALVLLNMELLETVNQLAARDPLTDLANRRSFTVALDREIAGARRSGNTLGVIFLDVDHFKAINDRFGHDAGDAVLREVANSLRVHGRGADLVARYGGEEFIVLLPDTDLQDAAAAAERIRRSIALGVRSRPVTLSAGVAVFPNHGDSASQIIQSADAAMYEAKRRGRNRTVTVDVDIAPLQLQPLDDASGGDDEPLTDHADDGGTDPVRTAPVADATST